MKRRLMTGIDENEFEEGSSEELTLVLETKNQIYAGMIKDTLEEKGITVLLKSQAGYYLRGMLPINQDYFNVKIYVLKKHESEAHDIVETIVPPEEIL